MKLKEIFTNNSKPKLSIFYTAGFPELKNTESLYLSLQESEVDFVEIGFPFSDPIADGSTIQKTSEIAIKNGMSLEVLFSQLRNFKDKINMPIILMGYLNPVVRYGVERFISDCKSVNVSGLILPDLPMYEYENTWKEKLEANDISLIFLITPQTEEDRIKEIDNLTTSFIYAVSSNAVTGDISSNLDLKEKQETFYKKLKSLNLKNPVIVGFGIKDKESFELASKHLSGAIIGSEFLRRIENVSDSNLDTVVKEFVLGVRGA
jgi:tryptophan synthase alpha chain